MANQSFADLLDQASLGLSVETIQKIVQFRELVVDENSRQNLTRLLESKDFFEGHVLDAIELLKSGLLEYPCMDLGSGAGVPGLLCSIIDPKPWVLVDSEGHKAAFLDRAAKELHLSNVSVVSGRAEEYLKNKTVETVVARAVGTVTKIYGWLAPCSTWNNLVLLKGPGWATEWEDFQKTGQRQQLKPETAHEYAVGAENKRRVIVKLRRVPRGTTS